LGGRIQVGESGSHLFYRCIYILAARYVILLFRSVTTTHAIRGLTSYRTYVEAASNTILPYLQSKGDGFYSNRDVYDLNIGDVFDQSFHKVVTEVLKFIADVRWFGRLWVVQEIALAKDGVVRNSPF
jgi:hypothetical protein